MIKCRAFLSPSFKKSGTFVPSKDPDEEFLLYRCNLGVVSMNLPMIYQKSVSEGLDFWKTLDYYMEMIRDHSKRTVSYLSKLKASCNPLMFCEGGLAGGNLQPDETIAPVLKYSTISFGYLGLNEVERLHSGKSLYETQEFTLKVLNYINDKIQEYKKADKILYALYSTPGESLCSIAEQKFIDKYGKIDGVTDYGYWSNSFHIHVTEDATPIQKMEIEEKYFPIPTGGRITYCRVPDTKNVKGIRDIVRLAMSKGLYYGVNHAENHCCNPACGIHWVGDDTKDDSENYVCPECGSTEVVAIRRMNGYLSYTNTKSGKSRFQQGKVDEIRDRKNM